jgi:ribonuclease P protein component
MQRLTQRADYLAAAAGVKVPVGAFILQSRQRLDTGPPRFGFTVSKKVGNAVERNRVRRRLREVVRLSAAPNAEPGRDYVLIGRRTALREPFERMIAELAGALKRVGKKRARSAAESTT